MNPVRNVIEGEAGSDRSQEFERIWVQNMKA